MKFNPDYHSSVISNLRQAYKAKTNGDCQLPDEKIWQLFEEWNGVVSDDPEETQDDLYVDAMIQAVNEANEQINPNPGRQ